MQLEERIDTLSKENKALKTTAEATQVLIKDLREELQQVCILEELDTREGVGMRGVMVTSLYIQSKEDYQKVVVKLTEDQQQHDSYVTEYKRVSSGGGKEVCN